MQRNKEARGQVTPGFVLGVRWFTQPLTANRYHPGGLRPLSA
jgi:hypothetical protein